MTKMAYANPFGPSNPYITYTDYVGDRGIGEGFQFKDTTFAGLFFDGYSGIAGYKNFIPKENCWAKAYYIPSGTDHNRISMRMVLTHDSSQITDYWMPLTKGEKYPLVLFYGKEHNYNPQVGSYIYEIHPIKK